MKSVDVFQFLMTSDCQFSATICPECDGYGLTTEVYNFRRLEVHPSCLRVDLMLPYNQRTCATCCSHGVILNDHHQKKNDCPVKEPNLSRKNDWIESEKKRYQK